MMDTSASIKGRVLMHVALLLCITHLICRWKDVTLQLDFTDPDINYGALHNATKHMYIERDLVHTAILEINSIN